MMASLVKRIVFVDLGGKTIQILFHRKSGELSLALLIHPVPMDVRESRIVDGRERFLQIGGSDREAWRDHALSLAGKE